MGLREGLMIIGAVILLLIVGHGLRSLRKVEASSDESMDDEEQARQAQLKRELPAGGARVIKTHDVDVFDDDPIPVLRDEVDLPPRHDDEIYETDYFDKPATGNSDDTYAEDSFDDGYRQALAADEETPAAHDAQSADELAYQDELLQAEHPEQNDSAELAANSEPAAASELTENPERTESTEAAADPQAESPEPAQRSAAAAGAEAVPETAPEAEDELSDEPQEPLETRFAREQARRKAELQERERKAEQEELTRKAMELAEKEDDPVKAAFMRISGKHYHTPRPSERRSLEAEMAGSAPEADAPDYQPEDAPEEMSLAEQQYLAQQAELEQAEAEREAALQAQEARQARARKRRPVMSKAEEQALLAKAHEMLVMHVKCKDPQGFHAASLMHVVMQCGLQLGEMQVFHRFERVEGEVMIQFSMMSSVSPGIFPAEQMDELFLPSVSLAMPLPAPGNSQDCFILMLETAKVIARNLNGELRDEARSVLTPQTIEHYKQRIQEFERRRQLEKKRR